MSIKQGSPADPHLPRPLPSSHLPCYSLTDQPRLSGRPWHQATRSTVTMNFLAICLVAQRCPFMFKPGKDAPGSAPNTDTALSLEYTSDGCSTAAYNLTCSSTEPTSSDFATACNLSGSSAHLLRLHRCCIQPFELHGRLQRSYMERFRFRLLLFRLERHLERCQLFARTHATFDATYDGRAGLPGMAAMATVVFLDRRDAFQFGGERHHDAIPGLR